MFWNCFWGGSGMRNPLRTDGVQTAFERAGEPIFDGLHDVFPHEILVLVENPNQLRVRASGQNINESRIVYFRVHFS